MLTFAVRNTLIIAGIAVLIGRSIGVILGMISGYIGGTWIECCQYCGQLYRDSSIAVVDSDRLDHAWCDDHCRPGNPDRYPRLGLSVQTLSRPDYEPARTRVHSDGGVRWHEYVEDRRQEHLPFLIPFLLADVVSGFLFAIGIEVTLSVLGLSDMNTPSIGTIIYWGNYYQALLTNQVWVLAAPILASMVIVVGFYMMSIGLSRYLDPRTRVARLQRSDRDHPRKHGANR